MTSTSATMTPTTTKVSFSLTAAANRKRKHKRKHKRKLPSLVSVQDTSEGDSSASSNEPQLRQLAGCFNVADNDADTDEQQWRPCAKQPRLTLEDAHAKAKRLQDEGSTLAEAGRFRAAIARWFEALDVDPTNAVTFELLAQASMALCDDFRAIQFALRATQLAPAWGDGFQTLARCHRNYGELELALRHIDTAIALTGATDELCSERIEMIELLAKQRDVLARREAEEAKTQDVGALQALACLKHLALRGQTTTTTAADITSRWREEEEEEEGK